MNDILGIFLWLVAFALVSFPVWGGDLFGSTNNSQESVLFFINSVNVECFLLLHCYSVFWLWFWYTRWPELPGRGPPTACWWPACAGSGWTGSSSTRPSHSPSSLPWRYPRCAQLRESEQARVCLDVDLFGNSPWAMQKPMGEAPSWNHLFWERWTGMIILF